MNMSAAVQHLETTLESIKGVEVNIKSNEKTRTQTLINVSLGTCRQVSGFGRDKYFQEITVQVKFHSGMTAPSKMAAKLKEIHDRIIFDRRRGGHAQTTTDPEFTKTEDNGRQGITYEGLPEIHTDESSFKER